MPPETQRRPGGGGAATSCETNLGADHSRPPRARQNVVVTLRAEPEIDATRAVKALLKIARRRLGLRCVAIRTADAP
jgi:hypothetical protein